MAFLLFRFQLYEIDSDEMLQMFMNKDEVSDMLQAISFRGNPTKDEESGYEGSDSISLLLRG